MTSTLRVNGPRELLSLLPYQLGFRPLDSLVLVSLRGPHRRVGLVARVDLPHLAHERAGAVLASSLLEHLARDGAAECVVVVYRDRDRRAEGDPLAERARERLEAPLGGTAVPVAATWCVTPTGWFDPDCRVDACCPPGGRPLADLESTRVSAEMVLRGSAVLASREDLAALPWTDAAGRRSARRARTRWAVRAESGRTLAETEAWRRDGLALWRREVARVASGSTVPDPDAATAEQPTEPVVAGRLQAALDDVCVRDAVLVDLVPGCGPVADRVLAGDHGADVAAALGRIVDPDRGVEPPVDRVRAARAVLGPVAALCRAPGHAPSLTLLGVLSWWEGDGARAGALLDRALEAQPGHRLAVLVADALAHGMPPGWVRRAGGHGAGPEGPGRAARAERPAR